MGRFRWLWICFALGAGAVLGAMAWLTGDVRALLRTTADAERQLRVDDAARAALWRMDSALAALIASEGSEAASDAGGGVPSPLDHLPRIRFLKGEDGTLRLLGRADGGEGGEDAARWLERLAALPSAEPASAYGAPARKPAAQADFQARQSLNINGNAVFSRQAYGTPRVVWLGNDALAVLRTGKGCAASGSAFAADKLSRALASSIADLMPGATVRPCRDPARAQYPLATAPLRLEPGALAAVPESPLMPTLVVAWVSVVVAILAMAALLAGVSALAERRSTFVSAVTHELRTPITSLRLYADMLAEGMAATEAKRAEYLATICSEAERLGRLVDNVLAFARLERGAAPAQTRPRTLGELVGACRERLARRAAEAGMELVISGSADDALARADSAMVEQILFNLVDNACKYAASASDKRVEVGTELRRGAPTVVVRDHGPGVASDLRRRMFRPFSRSAREAAGSAPGVGLGLALSRRLARRLGGELALEPGDGGASFALALPRG